MTPVTALPDLSSRANAADLVADRAKAVAPGFEAVLSQSGNDTSTLVAPERTPLTGSQAASALSDAWQSVTGTSPDRSTVAILAAHWAHETGKGQAMLNFNFAGIKGTGPSGLSASYKTREGWGANEVRTVDSFRAYRSAGEGAKDYVTLLTKHYPNAVKAAQAGDADGFVRALKDKGYFTGNETAYRKSLTSLSNQALAQGFDAMGTASMDGATTTTARPVMPNMDFRTASAVSFDSSMTSPMSNVDPAAFYDEIARATLRIAGDGNDDARAAKSII